ncbi:MAG: PEGA domain-containing protein [Burkholderiales bacterium]|nr:PEGA domain-containing protein [Opitutaceae bacterium]
MKLPRLLAALCPLALGLSAFAQPAPAPAPAPAEAPRVYSAAVVVSNRAEAKYNDQVSALEDLLSARLADLGFSLISRELVTSNLRAFTPPSAPTDAESARAAASAEAAFLDQSSALRLAQNLGADYVLHASITSISDVKRTVTAYGNTLDNHEFTLRVAYKLLDAQAGGALTGDVVKATRSEQASTHASAAIGGIIDDLLDDASRQITASLRTRRDAGRIAAAKPAAKLVTITLAVEAADLFIPDVRIGAENVVTVGESKFKVTPLNATVEVDGVAVGTAPGKVTLKPGFSRLRLSREGFKPWERTINAVDGQTLSVAMTMSDDGLERFKASTSWINELKNDAKLTDAEVKVLEGKAKSLENSFFRVDTKENFRFILPDRYQELPVNVNQQNTTINN